MTTTIDREKLTFTFQRSLRASCEEVFDAWTRPEQIAEWWDPTGAKLVECTVDLRVGGSFRFESAEHGPPFAGVYRTIERPSKLVFEALGAVGTVLLEADGDTTRLQVTIRCSSAEHFESFAKLGVHEGTGKTLDNLVRYVNSHAA